MATDLSISPLRGPWMTATLSRRPPSIALCTVTGEVDLMTVPELRAQLRKAVGGGCRDVVVDVTAITFFAVAGVRALDEAQRSRGDARDLVLVGASDQLIKVLDLCQARYPRYAELGEALAHCAN
jgi:anti-anti-sigma factor